MTQRPFSFQPCVGAYVGRAHMYAHFGAIACMRSRSPSAISYFSVCRGGGSQLRVFFLLCQTSRHFFHTLPSPSTAPTPTRVFFRRSTHFLGFSRSKIAKTLPGRDATSVLCPFSFQPCVGAYVGRAHTYAHFGAVACMRSRSPSATSYLSVCRGGGSQLRFFLYSVKPRDTFTTSCHHHPQHPRQLVYFSNAPRIL